MREATQKRLLDILEQTSDLMMTRGFRRTRLSDVAQAVGVSEPALYRYVESKDALFDLVVRWGGEPEMDLAALELPFATPAPDATIAYLSGFFAAEGRLPRLERALARTDAPSPAEARTEMESILRSVFIAARRYRRGARLINACKADLPALDALWANYANQSGTELLTTLLARRVEQRALRAIGAPEDVARHLLATCVTAAVYPELSVWGHADDEHIETVTVDALLAALDATA